MALHRSAGTTASVLAVVQVELSCIMSTTVRDGEGVTDADGQTRSLVLLH